eukprot:NODE_481_length_7843_cov_0.394835.p2 type:complete len:462 gc:universal NODE_481_length_7843_cov_0.394835:1944-559(-)
MSKRDHRNCYTCELRLNRDSQQVYCNKCKNGYHLECVMLKNKPAKYICGECEYKDDQFDRDCVCCEYHNGGIIQDNGEFMHSRCRYWSQMKIGPCCVCNDGDEQHFVITCSDCHKCSYHIPCALEQKLLPFYHPINLFQTEKEFEFICMECKRKRPVEASDSYEDRVNVFTGTSAVESMQELSDTELAQTDFPIDSLNSDENQLHKNVSLANKPKRKRFIEVLIPKKRKSNNFRENKRRHMQESDANTIKAKLEAARNRLKQTYEYIDLSAKEESKLDVEILELKSKLSKSIAIPPEVFDAEESNLLELVATSFVERIKTGHSSQFPPLTELVDLVRNTNENDAKLLQIVEDIQNNQRQLEHQSNRTRKLKLEKEVVELHAEKERIISRISQFSNANCHNDDYQDVLCICKQFLSNLSPNGMRDVYKDVITELEDICTTIKETDSIKMRYISAHANSCTPG